MPQRVARVASIVAWVLLAPGAAVADTPTYADQIRPIFQNSCLNCHNPDKRKAGLDLSTYEATMGGSDSGKVVEPGDAAKSLLFKLITHADEPTMPPKSDKLPDSQIAVIRAWIEASAPEKAGSMVVNKKADSGIATVAADETPKGPPPMPHDLLLEPVVHTQRAGAVAGMAASPWAPLVAVTGQRQVLLFNTDTLELAGILPFPEGFPDVLRFSRDGQLLLAGGGLGAKLGRVVVWDVASGRRVTEAGDEFDAVLAADISADRSLIALGGPAKLVKIFSAQDGKLLFKMKKHTDWVTALSFTPDGKLLVTGDRAGGLVVWDTKGREMQSISAHKGAITAIACHGATVATASEDGTVKFWDVKEGKETKSLQAHSGGATSVAFGQDGRLVTCGRDRLVKLWDAGGGQQRQFEEFPDIATQAVLAGGKVIGGDWSGVLRVWSTDGKRVGDLDDDPPMLADRVDGVTKRLAELTADYQKALAARAIAEEAAAKIGSERLAAVSAAAAMETQVKAEENRIAALGKDAEASAAALQKGRDDMARLEKEGQLLAENTGTLAAAREVAQREEKEVAAGMQGKQDLAEAARAAQAASAAAPEDKALADTAAKAKEAANKAADELDSHQKLASNKAQEARQLAESLAKLAETAAHHDSELASAREATGQRSAALEKAQADLAAAKADHEKHRAALAEMNGALPPKAERAKAAEMARDRARQEETNLAQELAAAKGDLARWKAAQVNVALHGARDAVDERQAECEKAQEAVDTASADLEKERAEVAAAEKALADAPGAVKAREAGLAAANAAIESASERSGDAKVAIVTRESLLATAADFSAKLRAESSKTPDAGALADAAQKAAESRDLIERDLAAAREKTAAAGGIKQAIDGLAAAQQALAQARAEADAAPARLQARRRRAVEIAAKTADARHLAEDGVKRALAAKAEAEARVAALASDYKTLCDQARQPASLSVAMKK